MPTCRQADISFHRFIKKGYIAIFALFYFFVLLLEINVGMSACRQITYPYPAIRYPYSAITCPYFAITCPYRKRQQKAQKIAKKTAKIFA